MEIKVHFRFNKTTGEIEAFEVDDQGPMRLPEAEHNRRHDEIAAEVGNVVERTPRVNEVFPGSEWTAATPEKPLVSDRDELTDSQKEKQKQKP